MGLFAYVGASHMALSEMAKEPNERDWNWYISFRDVGTNFLVDGVNKLLVPFGCAAYYVHSRL